MILANVVLDAAVVGRKLGREDGSRRMVPTRQDEARGSEPDVRARDRPGAQQTGAGWTAATPARYGSQRAALRRFLLLLLVRRGAASGPGVAFCFGGADRLLGDPRVASAAASGASAMSPKRSSASGCADRENTSQGRTLLLPQTGVSRYRASRPPGRRPPRCRSRSVSGQVIRGAWVVQHECVKGVDSGEVDVTGWQEWRLLPTPGR
jgi:hypothetical protein